MAEVDSNKKSGALAFHAVVSNCGIGVLADLAGPWARSPGDHDRRTLQRQLARGRNHRRNRRADLSQTTIRVGAETLARVDQGDSRSFRGGGGGGNGYLRSDR